MKALKFPSETWVCMFGKEIWSALKYRYIASRCVQTTSSVDKEICWGNRVSNPSVCIRARKEWKQRWMLILELLFVFFHTLYIFSQMWVYLVVSVMSSDIEWVDVFYSLSKGGKLSTCVVDCWLTAEQRASQSWEKPYKKSHLHGKVA